MMRILRICSAGLYQGAYTTFFIANNLPSASYDQAAQLYRDHGFMYPAGFQRHMKPLGYEVQDVVADFKPLQDIWWQEYKKNSETPSLSEVFMQQVATWQPDILYFQDLDAIPARIRISLKKQFSFIRIVTGFKGFPPHVFTDYQDFDFLFTPYPAYTPQWKKAGIETHYLPHCFDPGDNEWSRYESFQKEKTHPFVFVGSSGYGNANQQHRYELLRNLLSKTPLEVWGLEQQRNIIKDQIRSVILSFLQNLSTPILENLHRKTLSFPVVASLLRDGVLAKQGKIPVRDWYVGNSSLQKLFPDRYHPPVFGSEYLSIMSDSVTVLNIHTDTAGEAGNIRMFESTGSGACLLVDERPGLDSLFVPGVEIVTFSSDQDCYEKSKELLENPARAREVAEQGHARTMREHTSIQRCQTIASILSSAIG